MRTYAQQKAALTRALRSRDQSRVLGECTRVVNEWKELQYGWPDDWSRWQRALDDVYPVFSAPRLEDLA